MKKITQIDFFKQDSIAGKQSAEPKSDVNTAKAPKDADASNALEMSDRIRRWSRHCKEALEQLDMPDLAQRITQIQRDAQRNTFVVTVVGEFSRGKSTFINRLLGEELLPVGDLPTTTVLTRLRYNGKRVAARTDAKGQCVWRKPFTPTIWDSLSQENPESTKTEGMVMIGIDHPWLGSNAIEVIDTPGAGDLDDQRAQVIGNMLMRSDAIIITIDATRPMSMTEQTFMEQRVMARKTPYMMVVLNRLDMIPLKERSNVVAWVQKKLHYWNMDIPVYVPYEVEMPDDTYAEICGIDVVRHQIEQWSNDPERQQLLDEWVQMRTTEVLTIAESMLAEEEQLLNSNEEERKKAIDKKMQALDQMKTGWEHLQLDMRKRLEECFHKFHDKTEELTRELVEKLQYEAAHAQSPQRWWEEDYPYRLKKELANMGTALESIVTRIALEDVRWLNAEMSKQFQTTLVTEKLPQWMDRQEIASHTSDRQITFEDLQKRMNRSRLTTAALSIGGAIVLSATGFGILSIIATMGVGTGASIVTSDFFRKKIEQQRSEMKRMLAADVPIVVGEATRESENQITMLYHDIMYDARQRQQTWFDTQKQIIAQSQQPDAAEERKLLAQRLAIISNLKL